MRVAWAWIAIIILIIGGLGSTIAGGIVYTRSQVQHECQALNILVAIPVPKPADPKANPSREQNYLFHQALVSWAKSDGC